MAETGIVTGIRNSMLEIEMQRNDACAKCGACISFSTDNTMHLTAKNDCKAVVGDTVEITLESSHFLSAVAYLYGIPLIAFLASFFLCYAFRLTEGVTILISFATLGITWLIIHFLSKKMNHKRYMPRAIRIIPKNE